MTVTYQTFYKSRRLNDDGFRFFETTRPANGFLYTKITVTTLLCDVTVILYAMIR